MAEFDLLLRSGTVVTDSGTRQADIGICGGKLQLLARGQHASAIETRDVSGLHIFPGLIDSHVHFNEPGRTDWEGFATGSRALAIGGGTLFFDMPLNAHPPTIDAASFNEKLLAASHQSLVDFAFWGGLVPGNLERLEELADCGVVGFKAFMSNSGMDDFPCVDDQTLRKGMKKAAALRRPVAVHAESEELTQKLARACLASGRSGVRDFLDSRPVQAELDAIARALEFAGETRCPLHVVHVSCGAGIALIQSARSLGVDVTCETCPHYLTLTDDDMIRLGAVAKCAPPLRPKTAQTALWKHLQAENVQTIGSDHSPSPPSLKLSADFFKVWGGISSVQYTLPLLLTEGHVNRGLPLPLIAKMTACNPASRFHLLPDKSGLSDGADADLAVVDLGAASKVSVDEIQYRHKQTPYVGRRLTGRVVQTILRGQTVCKNGRCVSEPKGRLVRPNPTT